MTRIHYEMYRKRLEALRKRKLTPFQVLAINCHLASEGIQEAEAVGGERFDSLKFNQANAMVSFHTAGRQCFELGDKLTETFAQVDLTKVEIKCLRMPYDCFWITLPKGTGTIWGGRRTGFHDIGGMYVSKQNIHGTENLNLLIHGRPNKFSTNTGDDAIAFLTIDLDNIANNGKNFEQYLTDLFAGGPSYSPNNFKDDIYGLDTQEEIIDHQPLPGLPGTPVKVTASYEVNSPKGHAFPLTGPAPSKEALRQHTDDAFRAMTRIAVNTILYLTSPKNEVEVDEKQQKSFDTVESICKNEKSLSFHKAKRLATKVSKKKYTRLTRLAPTLEKKLKTRKGGWTMAHWQIYWTGPGRKIATPIFKLPFLRGEDPNEDGVRNYSVREEKKTGS